MHEGWFITGVCMRVCVEVEGPKQDLHSGVFGGTVMEPMTDLIGILGELLTFHLESFFHP